ncbi:MAG: quinol:electron acceptor oxidoreductase subunit ActD [Planctomycetota bacterium]
MSDQAKETRLHGVIAEYHDVDGIMAAAAKVRDAGFTKWDCHTPFPVHGLDDAMGVRPTVLPWIALGAGLVGLAGAVLMQWWMNAVDYPFSISGKPLFSLPANVPVIFEGTVLFAAVTTFFCVIVLNKLPRLYSPLHHVERFKRSTDDCFFVVIEAADPAFDEKKVASLLEATGADSVDMCHEETGGGDLPKVLVACLIGLTVLSFVPFALAYRARAKKTEIPRFHLVKDMDHQAYGRAQAESKFFADGRMMRAQVAGTQAFGEMIEADSTQTGKTGPGENDWAQVIPIPVTREMIDRGKNRFDIFCAVCHGYAGDGDGAVAVRAQERLYGAFIKPASIHEDPVNKRPPGQLFDTISNGVRTMKGYGSQIVAEDRWAIVLYLKALQLQRNAKVSDLPAELRNQLK